jgi:hypothetical protein
MDIEFHYHITFILARKSGFSAKDAYVIAYSSQYTDDNTYHYYVNFEDGSFFLNEISQTMDITKPSLKRQKIYPLFHFIPGGEECEDRNQFKRSRYHFFTTIPDSPNARALFDAALKSRDLYRIGIATHAYADTWAHQNFIGFKHRTNGKRYDIIIPNIGHADFMHEPDRVHNEWVDTRLKNQYVAIDNDKRFLAAAEAIFIRLWKYNHRRQSDRQAKAAYDELSLEQKLKDAMDETYFWGSDERIRIKAYKKICTELGVEKYQYDPKAWRYEAVEKIPLEFDLFDRYWAKKNSIDSHWYRFQEAVKAHRDLALDKFKPLFKKVKLRI